MEDSKRFIFVHELVENDKSFKHVGDRLAVALKMVVFTDCIKHPRSKGNFIISGLSQP